MTDRIWVLGAPDPEMNLIELLLKQCGETVSYAVLDGQRVRPGTAYHEDATPDSLGEGDPHVYAVECLATGSRTLTRIDHHQDGDPGYGKPPSTFMTSSSIGQVITELARLQKLPYWPAIWSDVMVEDPDGEWGLTNDRYVVVTRGVLVEVPWKYKIAAAADHCLAAAYRGECGGVDPEELLLWRVKTRSKFQKRPEEELLADIEAARQILKEAPSIPLRDGVEVKDIRRDTPIPELVEAGTRDDVAYLSGPLIGPDGRHKYTCSGNKTVIQAFMQEWAPANGLKNIYGDPERGFAGGYA